MCEAKEAAKAKIDLHIASMDRLSAAMDRLAAALERPGLSLPDEEISIVGIPTDRIALSPGQ